MIPLVAIVGRPNVGKSALFNRLVEQKHAIVTDDYGTTRDELNATIIIKKKEIELMDMAGIMMSFNDEDPLHVPVQKQARVAMEQADLVLFCVDGLNSLTSDDREISLLLRKSKKPVLFVVTKADTSRIEGEATEVYELGWGDPLFVSSSHNRGFTDLKEAIHERLKKEGCFKKENLPAKKSLVPQVSFCLVGKPNVGKSSLFNAMLKKSKAVVSEVPGTTRDTLDSELHYGDMMFKVIDTAGLKRPGKATPGLEKYIALRTMRAIKRSDICLLVLDGLEKITKMDQAVSRYILDEKKGLIIVVNKWDLLETETNIMDRFLTYLQAKFDYLPWAPVLFVSAKTGKHVGKILDRVWEVYQERQKRVDTGPLNRFIEEVCAQRFPTGTKKINPKIFYTTQVDVDPPQFVLFVNEKEAFHFSWVRYLENRLREEYGFVGTPIALYFKNRTRKERD